MDIERRIDNLEKLVHAFITQSNNKAFYDNADKDGIKQRANAIYEEVKADIDYVAIMTDTYVDESEESEE